MTPSVESDREAPGRPRRRLVRLTAVGVTVGVAAAAIVGSTGATAAAVAAPQAQSVGNFLDATVGGNTLDAIAKLKYASAKAPGSTSVQNPLDATALNAINLPLTGALQLPTIGATKFGAVNQVAQANLNGASYGAAGAVQNSGGVSIGGNNSDYPANATIDLTASALGGSTAAALGGITATIGGVAALASTPKGYGKPGSTAYQIANVDLSIGSPLLGGLLTTLTSALNPTALTSTLTSGLAGLPVPIALPTDCALTSGTLPTLSLEGGALTINATTGTIAVSLGKLLQQLGLDLNKLPANTDLIDYLLAYLADPKGLATGLESLISGVTGTLTSEFTKCTAALDGLGGLGTLLGTLTTALTGGQTTLTNAVNGLLGSVTGAAGVNPLAPLATGLKNLIDIGVNVQPNGKAGTYTDPLAATPKQGTPVVKGQTIVRAIELNIAGAASGLGLGSGLPTLGSLGLPSLPGVNSFSSVRLASARYAAPRQAAAAGTGIATLALANAAAGPSTAPAVTTPTPTTSAPTTTPPVTDIPTGVPAGAAGHTGGGSPALPIVLVLIGLMLAGGGVTAYRGRAKFMH